MGNQHAQLRHGNFKVKREGTGSECLLFVQTAGGADPYYMFSRATEEPSRCPVQLFRYYAKKWYVLLPPANHRAPQDPV